MRNLRIEDAPMRFFEQYNAFLAPIHDHVAKNHWQAAGFVFKAVGNRYIQGEHFWDSFTANALVVGSGVIEDLSSVLNVLVDRARQLHRQRACPSGNNTADGRTAVPSPMDQPGFKRIQESCENYPGQDNGDDCGVFAIKRMESVAADTPPESVHAMYMPFYREEIGIRLLRALSRAEAEGERGLPMYLQLLALAYGAQYVNPPLSGSNCVATCLDVLGYKAPEPRGCTSAPMSNVVALGEHLRGAAINAAEHAAVSISAVHRFLLEEQGAESASSAILLVLEDGRAAPIAIRLGCWFTGNPAPMHHTDDGHPLPILVLHKGHLSVLHWLATGSNEHSVEYRTKCALCFVNSFRGAPRVWTKFDASDPSHAAWVAAGDIDSPQDERNVRGETIESELCDQLHQLWFRNPWRPTDGSKFSDDAMPIGRSAVELAFECPGTKMEVAFNCV